MHGLRRYDSDRFHIFLITRGSTGIAEIMVKKQKSPKAVGLSG